MHANPLMLRQHSMEVLLGGSTMMLAKADVADVVPRRTKYGDNPNEVPRAMMR